MLSLSCTVPVMHGCGGGGGSPQGLVHNLLMQFFTLGSSKIEGSETYFFEVVTTQYDHSKVCKALTLP